MHVPRPTHLSQGVGLRRGLLCVGLGVEQPGNAGDLLLCPRQFTVAKLRLVGEGAAAHREQWSQATIRPRLSAVSQSYHLGQRGDGRRVTDAVLLYEVLPLLVHEYVERECVE